MHAVHNKTRQRLLEAAAIVFADRGFRHATIREICSHAGTNIAAVNYHFGDKRHLYEEVIATGMRVLKEEIMIETRQNRLAPPRDRLELFMHSLLRHVQAGHRSSTYIKLMTRGMVEQTDALDIAVAEVIRPLCKELESIARELWGAVATERQVRLFCASVVGQGISYFCGRSLLVRLYPDQPYPDDQVTRLPRATRHAS